MVRDLTQGNNPDDMAVTMNQFGKFPGEETWPKRFEEACWTTRLHGGLERWDLTTLVWDICQPVRLEWWDLLAENSQRETEDYIQDMDLGLVGACVLENCHLATQILELMEYQNRPRPSPCVDTKYE